MIEFGPVYVEPTYEQLEELIWKMNFELDKLVVNIRNDGSVMAAYDTGNFLTGTVSGECSYDNFKAFLAKMNGLVAAHERVLRDAQPKDAA